ncbi:MAG: GNAT family N-acetyltransferase [Ilumatobacteraceae bacterium]
MAVERIVDDPAGAAASIAAGGRLDRHSVVMVLDPADAPSSMSLAVGFSIAPMDEERVAEYGEVVGRAYPPSHPDHEPADADPDSAAEAFRHFMRGEQIGPWIAAASLHVTDDAGRVVGLILVNETGASELSDAGPFVTDVCVDPVAAGNGIGRALLVASAGRLAELGWAVMTLVVTVGNPARQVYERLGFRVSAETWRIEVPD